MVKKSYLKRINCLLVNLTRFQLNFPKYDLALKKKKRLMSSLEVLICFTNYFDSFITDCAGYNRFQNLTKNKRVQQTTQYLTQLYD